MKKQKKKPWRIFVFLLSIAFIVCLWVKKDVASIYQTAPKEQVLPLIITSVAVSLLKVLFIAGAVLLLKWILSKLSKRK